MRLYVLIWIGYQIGFTVSTMVIMMHSVIDWILWKIILLGELLISMIIENQQQLVYISVEEEPKNMV